MAEPIKIPMYGSLWISDAPKETLLGVWQTIIDSSGVTVNENEKVLSIQREDEGFFITTTPKGTYRSQKIILAIGKRGTPNELPVPGNEHSKVLYTLTDTAQYTNSKILVVGGGDSAAEAAITLAKQPGNEVILSYRRSEFSRLKPKNLEGIQSSASSGGVRLLLGSQVTEITPASATLQLSSGELWTLENDYVFAFLGGTSPKSFLGQIGVEMVTKEVALSVQEGRYEAV
jgi:thioredoxin reductase